MHHFGSVGKDGQQLTETIIIIIIITFNQAHIGMRSRYVSFGSRAVAGLQ
jgi:hypothetical protein